MVRLKLLDGVWQALTEKLKIDRLNQQVRGRVDAENQQAKERVDAENQQKKNRIEDGNKEIAKFNSGYLKRAFLSVFGPVITYFGFLFYFVCRTI